MRFHIGQKYKKCQVSSARIVSNNILIIYMTLLKTSSLGFIHAQFKHHFKGGSLD